MKFAIPLALALCFSTADASVRDDRVSLWADDEMTYCSLVSTPGVRSVYMFHTSSEMVTAVRFSAPKPACWTGATWLGDFVEPSLLALGSSQTDLSIAYNGCTLPPVFLGRIDYLVTGIAPNCCEYEVLPVPTTPPGIWVVDCQFVEHEAAAGRGVLINPTPNCLCAEPPPPSPDGIALFADAVMGSCSLMDSEAGVKSIHMFHTGLATTMGAQFSVPLPACWNGATWLADHIAPPFLFLGNSQTDLSIVYGTCQEPPVYLGRVDFYTTGVAGECCDYVATAAVGAPGIWVVDCDFDTQVANATGRVVINPTAQCPCGSEPPVSVEETTWGRIKAMYR